MGDKLHFLNEPTNAQPNVNYINSKKTIASWLFTLDHKRIGVMYLISIFSAFALGGLMALLMRLELFSPGESWMSAETYSRIFTLHGLAMVFLFIIPGIPATLGNFILPLMLGVKNVAFPKLNLASFYIYLIGACMALYTITTGSGSSLWTFYTPKQYATDFPMITMTISAFILGVSSILTSINFIVTIHHMRMPKLSWKKLPLFVWSLYATSIVQLIATPVLAIVLLLLMREEWLGVGVFDPTLGGDSILFQHFFWFYSHPAIYIMILPGMGVISELISCFSRTKIFGYMVFVYASIMIALMSFLVWGYHILISAESTYAKTIFTSLTLLLALPSAIKVVYWCITLYKGKVRVDTPMLWAFSFLILFTIGGSTGIYLAIWKSTSLYDTYFVVAQFHYIMMGGTVMAFFGGIHYWWPKMFGKNYSETWGKVSAILVFIGFNITFLPQFIMGLNGMPRRYYDYAQNSGYERLHQISTIGNWIMLVGMLIMLVYLVRSLKRKSYTSENPWQAHSLEWSTQSPPLPENFPSNL
jgi:cytochrome c oxidase subunit I